ncbi:hypothetical protein AVEN_49647-1 [Araneus ventricosus]|uniref:Uncharacterized protein n=1 Tax=Araneus ventricosus TaxID=182803 RepID=A0A4Y2H5T2_ARAVE|nr:hypothetical protein AVEN_49647-1 [Araneus ventricosus]
MPFLRSWGKNASTRYDQKVSGLVPYPQDRNVHSEELDRYCAESYKENLEESNHTCHTVRRQLKNDRCNSLDTEVGLLTAFTDPSRRRYASSTVRSNSTHTITMPTREARTRYGNKITYPATSRPHTRGAPSGEYS